MTGLGAITPIGNTAPETWAALLNGVSGAGPITQFDASKFKTQFACEVKGFDASKHFDRKEARKYDRYAQLALVSATEAIEDAALDLEKEDLNRIGVIFAAGIGGIRSFEDEVRDYNEERGPRFNPSSSLRSLQTLQRDISRSNTVSGGRTLPPFQPALRRRMRSPMRLTISDWVRPTSS